MSNQNDPFGFNITDEMFNKTQRKYLIDLEKSLPVVFDRKTAEKHLGGLINQRTLANLDCLGTGPATTVRIGRRIGYERDTFMEWVKEQLVDAKK